MENVSQIVQNLNKTADEKQSTGLGINTLQRLKQLMQGMRAYFPNAPITDEVAAEYANDWIALVKHYGIERFEEGAVQARRYKMLPDCETVARQFFPLPGEIEDFIRHKTAPLMRAVTDLECPDCKGTGWKFRGPVKSQGVVRCHCRQLVRREA